MGKVMSGQCFEPLRKKDGHWVLENKCHLMQLSDDKSVSLGLGVWWKTINKPCSTSISQVECLCLTPSPHPLSYHPENQPSCLEDGHLCHHPLPPGIPTLITPQHQAHQSTRHKLKLCHQDPHQPFPLVHQIVLGLLLLQCWGCVQSSTFGLWCQENCWGCCWGVQSLYHYPRCCQLWY